MQKRSKYQISSDAAKQRWVRDDRKESFWRRHIEAWKNSGLSKRGYCIANDLSQSSFNAWNREITLRDREKIPSTNATELLSVPPEKNPFVPLRLLPDEMPIEPPASIGLQTRTINSLEILVPGGAIIRINEGLNVDVLAELYSSLSSGGAKC